MLLCKEEEEEEEEEEVVIYITLPPQLVFPRKNLPHKKRPTLKDLIASVFPMDTNLKVR